MNIFQHFAKNKTGRKITMCQQRPVGQIVLWGKDYWI